MEEGAPRLIRPDENKLMVIQQLTQRFKAMQVDPKVPSADVVYYMYTLPLNIKSLKFANCNFELNRIFSKELKEVTELQLDNSKGQRKKKLNQNQTRCLVKAFPMLQAYKVRALDLPNSEIFYWTNGFKQLKILHLFQQNNLNDDVLGYVAECGGLVEFGVGGRPDDFNRVLTAKGFVKLEPLKHKLRKLSIQFASQIGDNAIKVISENLNQLTDFEIKRNCFDTSEDITDQGIVSLGDIKNLERLSLIYCRNFGQKISVNIAQNLTNIRYLCLRSCTIFEQVDILSKLTKLQELDLGGDSWVRPNVLVGISKLRISVFHMGHFDHGQTSCQQIIASYPPEGIFVHNLFKTQKAFYCLNKLYLEQCCTLTFWLDIRIKLARPTLQIFYRQKEQFQ